MKKIKLGISGKFALIDDEDFERVSEYAWYICEKPTCLYAITRKQRNRKVSYLRMHRIILGITDSSISIDHINHNGLDNRRINLRVCTAIQNSMNRRKSKTSTNKYKGVAYVKVTVNGKDYFYWRARIKVGNRFYTKTARQENLAAEMYNEMAIKYYKEFASLNPIS